MALCTANANLVTARSMLPAAPVVPPCTSACTTFKRARSEHGELNGRAMRVAIFTPAYHVLDGVTVTIRKIRAHCEKHGIELRIFSTTPPHGSEPDPVILHQKGVCIPYEGNHDYRMCVGMTDQAEQDLREFKPDIVHVTAPDFLALDTIKWCHANNTAIIATWHSNLPEYTEHYRHLGLNLWLKPIMHSYFRSFYARVPHTYAPQQAVVELMRTAGYENASTRNELRVWGRGVNTSNFTPAKRSCRWRSSLGIADTDVVLLWVGRCVPEKSPQVWISVMRALQQMYSHVRGVVVGRGAFYDEMVAIPGVTGLGWLNVDQLSAAYANADVLLFPSRVETFGNVTLEAMASGCPCVVDAECSGHLIKDGANGFAVVTGAPGAKEDASAYLDAVKALVENDELRRTFSEANREIAERVYGLEAVNARMIDNYREAIAESRVESGRRKFSLHETPAMVLWSYIAIFFAALTCILMTPEKGLFKNNARGLRLLMVVKGIKLAILGALLVLLDSFVHLTAVVQHFQAAAKLV